MKKTFLILLLCFVLLLCACQRQEPGDRQAQQPTAVPATAAPTQSAAAPAASVSPAPSASAQATPQAQTPEAEPSASPAAESPVDLQKAAPLFKAVAETLVVDGDMRFKRYPDPALVDAVLARLLRDMGQSDRYHIAPLDSKIAVYIDAQSVKTLYADCFSEGEFAGLPEKGYGEKKNDGGIQFALPDNRDLQFSVQLNKWQALQEENYYELAFTLDWAYPEDAQATNGGGFKCWVKKNDDSPYGLGLALLEPQVALRPGDDFGSHPARDVEQIMPMLHALAKACVLTGDGFTQKPSDTFAFEAAYALLNSYGGDFGLDASNASAKVSKQMMDSAMAALFGPEYKTPASVPSALRGRLQGASSGYSLKFTKEETTPIFTDYAVLSNTTEWITLSLRSGEKTEASPLEYLGSTRVAVAIGENLPYRNRYAVDVNYTPERNQ